METGETPRLEKVWFRMKSIKSNWKVSRDAFKLDAYYPFSMALRLAHPPAQFPCPGPGLYTILSNRAVTQLRLVPLALGVC